MAQHPVGGGLAQAANFSPEHNFLVFNHRTLEADGTPGYEPYSRFPVGIHGLVKLTLLPFGHDDLEGQILAARLLMLAFFAGAAVLAWLSLARLGVEPAAAAAATLLAFVGLLPLLRRRGDQRGVGEPVRPAAHVPRHRYSTMRTTRGRRR